MFGSLNRDPRAVLTLGASQGSRDVALWPGGPFVVSAYGVASDRPC